jgi:hypothetical protein
LRYPGVVGVQPALRPITDADAVGAVQSGAAVIVLVGFDVVAAYAA